MKKILFIASLLLLTGCVTRQSVQTMIDTQIDAHHETVMVPAVEALEARTGENRRLIFKTNARISTNQDLLRETFKLQKRYAETAIELLEPDDPETEALIDEPKPMISPETVPEE